MTDLRDPVCGMEFTLEEAQSLGAESADHGDETYWFCSPVCKETFLGHPEAYAKR